MPDRSIGREITVGTICRDRWRASVRLVCGDRIPEGGTAPLYVDVRWRNEQGEPSRPEDAEPITLTLRRRTSSASGDIRFDRPDGPLTRSYRTDAEQLLTLHGVTASAGDADDVVLAVAIEGETRGEITLSVGPLPLSVLIRAADGVTPPSELIARGAEARYAAVVRPETPGAYRWVALGGTGLTILGAADQRVVSVRGAGGAAAERALIAIFQPAEGPAVVAAQRLAVVERAPADDPASLVPFPVPRVVAAGWSTGSARPGDTVQMLALVSGGMAGQRVTFEVSSVTSAGSIALERIDRALGSDDLLRVDWRVPEAIPGEGVEALGFTAAVMDEPLASADHDALPGHAEGPVHARLSLFVTLRLQLTDSTGRALRDVRWELRDIGGVTLEQGTTGADGNITIADLTSQSYALVVEDVTVFDVSEQAPSYPPPSPEHTVFSFVDLRLPAAGTGTNGASTE